MLRKSSRVLRILLLIGLAFLFAENAASQGFYYNGFETRYELSVHPGDVQYFYVTIHVAQNDAPRLVFSMPAWIPGGYMLGNFARRVRGFSAKNGKGEALKFQKIDPNSWEVQTNGCPKLDISYKVDVAHGAFMGKAIDKNYALVNGPSTYMYIRGHKSDPVTVFYNIPSDWKIATGLEEAPVSRTFTAPNYDVFADAPALLGKFKQFRFEVKGVPHIVAINGPVTFDTDAFLRMVKKIVTYETQGIYQDIPYKKYVFIYTIYPGMRGGGGLEHLNSTTIGLSGARLKMDINSGADVTAHEFFHVWNVKRIHPEVLGPFDYSKDVRTKSLWVCEGITSYYADLTLARTGIWGEEKFLKNQAKMISELQSNPDRLKTSAEMASWKIWETGYGGSGISFYTKGQILGMLLDLKIRHLTNNQRSLDDVMRFLNQWFAKWGVGYKDSDILRAVNAVTNKDFREFFERYVSGTVELPYNKILAYAGLKPVFTKKTVPYIGKVAFFGPKNRVFAVDSESPVGKAGLMKEDHLLKMDGKTIKNRKDFTKILNSKKPGDSIKLIVERAGKKLTLLVPVQPREKVTCTIEKVASPTPEQLMMRKTWLHGESD
ncbi:MAG: M61 family metallopeptidase [Calditrichaeota bacterium]|nr:M61 family metallopeptidase [Calditrichota bacterium]